MNGNICSPQWRISGQSGCCGIGTVARLRAVYPKPSVIAKSLIEWEHAPDAKLLNMNSKRIQTFRMQGAIQEIQRYPYTPPTVACTPCYLLPTIYFAGTAIDQSMAFGAVLDSMTGKSNYVLWFFSDNVQGYGDVHLGAFSTHEFVLWLINNNLGQMQTSGPVKSKRTHHNIQGWLFTMNWDECNAMVKKQRDRLRTQIKEWNSNVNIKEKGQAERATHATKSRKLSAGFDGAWIV